MAKSRKPTLGGGGGAKLEPPVGTEGREEEPEKMEVMKMRIKLGEKLSRWSRCG